MASMIPFILLAVPCALCVWLWWTMSGNGGKHKAHTSRRVSVSPQRFGKIQGETSHKDYADRPVQSKSDLPRTPLYDGEPLKVTPLGDSRAVQLETTLVDRVERPPRDFVSSVQYERKPSPYMRQAGEVALAFRVGNRYYNETKNRVFECIALKGKKARLVAFACLDSVEKELAFLKDSPEFGGFYKVRTDGGVETCQRGALRADRQATEKEVADEFDFLRQLRNSKPSGMVQMSVTIGDKTYTSG